MTDILVLHGGGGPGTVAGLAAHLQASAPTHPGWNGTPMPPEIDSVAALAEAYLRELPGPVIVVGSSIGGWIAAEMALRDRAKNIRGLVIINAAGIDAPEHPITNITGLAPPELARLAFHDPAKFSPPPPEALPMMRANQAALAKLAGAPYMHDPTLLRRLGEIRVPTLVVWGESDRVITADYGRAYAAAIPDAAFELVPEAGHLPHLEQPTATYALIDRFVRATA